MTDAPAPPDSRDLRGRLETIGDPRDSERWMEGDTDYVTMLGLTPADVPQLLAVTRDWVERTDWPDDENDVTVWAGVHAWRALGQLPASEAVPVLLAMLDPLDERMDDWSNEEFPHVFALVGPEAVEPLTAYMAEAEHAETSRICVANGLSRIAERQPGECDRVVKTLAGQLEEFASQPETFNAFLISYLLNLKAKEAADVIERAYAADRVDVQVIGNWNSVRDELGVEGRGLVPPGLAGQKPPPLFPGLFAPPQESDFGRHRKKLKGSSTAASVALPPGRDRRREQRKRDRQNRKRNRKR